MNIFNKKNSSTENNDSLASNGDPLNDPDQSSSSNPDNVDPKSDSEKVQEKDTSKTEGKEETKPKPKVKEIFRVHCPHCSKENDNPGKAKKIPCSRCGLVLNVKLEGKKIYGTTGA